MVPWRADALVLREDARDLLPLYRQSEIYARDGLDLPRGLLAGWVGRSAELAEPMAAYIGRHALAGRRVHADDTPMPMLSPGRGRTQAARFWAVERHCSGTPAITSSNLLSRLGNMACRWGPVRRRSRPHLWTAFLFTIDEIHRISVGSGLGAYSQPPASFSIRLTQAAIADQPSIFLSLSLHICRECLMV